MRRLGALLVLLLALAGCRGEEEAAREPLLAERPEVEGPAPAVLRWAIGDVEAIVPPLATTPDELRVADAVFDGLTRLDEDLEPQPALAEGWRHDDRARVWTFRLRPDATFHDGTPVTAADVRFTWEEGVREGRVAPHLRDVRGYEALVRGEADGLDGVLVHGERTVQVLLERPRADLAVRLAHPSLAPVPEAAYRADPEGFARQPLGAGAYALREPWSPGAFARLHRVEGRQGPEEVLFRFTDPTTGYIAFQQGRVDLATVPEGALAEAEGRYGRAEDGRTGPGVLGGEAAQVYLLGLRLDEPPFDDTAVRRALSFAIDRGALVEDVADGGAVVARGLTPRSVPGGAVSACSTCLHAPNAAERVFAERDIDALELWIDRGGGHRLLAERLEADLAAVGVALDVREVDTGELYDAIEDGRASLYRYGWTLEHPTPEDVVVPLLHSASQGVAGGNPGGFASEEVDGLIDEALATTDRDDRLALLRSAETLGLGREQATIPLLFPTQRLVVGDRVDGFVAEPTGRADLERVDVVED